MGRIAALALVVLLASGGSSPFPLMLSVIWPAVGARGSGATARCRRQRSETLSGVAVACEGSSPGYGPDGISVGVLLAGATIVLDVDCWETVGRDVGMVQHARWKAVWFRAEADR